MIRFSISDFEFWTRRTGRTRLFGFALVTLLVLSLPAQAQQFAKKTKIGELLFRDRTDLGAGRQVFRGQLRALGYIEGKNIIYETRSAKGKLERFPALAEELVRSRLMSSLHHQLLKHWR